jgi:peptidoglycan hydrolase-like protein with peptidoglycan-binding domain
MNADEALPQTMNIQSAQPVSSAAELIKAAQIELGRLGCFTGEADGTMNAATTAGINQYLSRRGIPDPQILVTENFVSELRGQPSNICAFSCPAGQIANASTCVATKKPSRQKEALQEDDDARDKPKKDNRLHQHEAKRRPQQEVSAYPREFHSGGGGVIGVGF